MKRENKENLKIARILFEKSFEDEKPAISKMKQNMKFLKATFKRKALKISSLYFKLIKNYIKDWIAVVESSDKLDKGQIEKIKNYFGKKRTEKLEVALITDPKLLGGIKITIGDNQWDFSVEGKINQIKETLSGRYLR